MGCRARSKTTRRATALVAATAFAGCWLVSASAQSTQFGTAGEYRWLRESLRDPGKLAETIAKCQEFMPRAPNMHILANRTGIAEDVLRQTFCQRYYGGLASGRISLREYLHQDKPTQNYIRVLQGR